MSRDPYRYFRIEAQELLEGLSRGLLAIEKDGDPERVRELLRQAHTFKGAARVVRQVEIGDLAHQLEELLARHRHGGAPVPRDTVDRGLGLLDGIRTRVASLGPPAPTAHPAQAAQPEQPAQEVESAPPTPAPSDETLRTVRLEIADMDALLEGLSEAGAAIALSVKDGLDLEEVRVRARELVEVIEDSGAACSSRLLSHAEALVELVDRLRLEFLEHSQRADREIAALQEMAAEFRLVPAQALVVDLERAIRDAAQSLGKQVTFRSKGSDTRIDAHVLSGLRSAMLHLARNAVAHGIEDPEARLLAGKPAAGVVEVSVDRRGHRVSLTCSDDGAGLDVESVRRVAVERGLISERESTGLNSPELFQLLLRGGLSTTPAVNVVSGRGIGLDVVRAVVESLKGEVEIQSNPGAGTSVTVVVPVSLSSLPALTVEVDGSTALIPLDSVRRTTRLRDGDLSRSAGGERVVVDESPVPFLELGRALRSGSVENGKRRGSAVVVEAGGRTAAVGVDRVCGVRNILVRSLPRYLAIDAVVVGAALDETGVPLPVLAPTMLVELAREPYVPSPLLPRPRLLPILIVDDSLTTRMLEQSILESAGYEVDLAVSGEEALRKAKARSYSLFIVDIEMPGMSGFDFIAHTRADPELREVPSVLVTSRGNVEDKRRGRDVGARAYIVKSEFDQEELLSSIRSLVG